MNTHNKYSLGEVGTKSLNSIIHLILHCFGASQIVVINIVAVLSNTVNKKGLTVFIFACAFPD